MAKSLTTRNIHDGFTLLEIVVVLGIIAILTGVAMTTFRFDRGEHYLDDHVQQIVQLYRGVRDEAILSGNIRRLTLEESNKLVAQKRLAPDNFTYTKDDVLSPIVLNHNSASMHIKPKEPIFFFPSGQTTPFQLNVEFKDNNNRLVRRISGDAMGRISLSVP